MSNKDHIKSTKEFDLSNLEKKEMKYEKRDRTLDIALSISLIYSAIGALWILLSDQFIEIITRDKKTITFISMIKGWVYVGITGAIIYYLVAYYVNKNRNSEKNLIRSDLKLSLLNKDTELLKNHLKLLINDKIALQKNCLCHQEQLNDLEEVYNVIMENTSEVIWEETNGHMHFSNRWYEITGYSREEYERNDQWEDLLHPVDKFNFLIKSEELLRNKSQNLQSEFRIMTKWGHYKWLKTRGKYFFNPQGQVYRKIGIITDISYLKEYEQKLYNYVCYDQLTGLLNRFALNDILVNMISGKANTNFALLIVDIDNFKNVNDTKGHTFGDSLLIQVSERLKDLYTNEAKIFRISGDEFVVLINPFEKKEEIERKAVDIIRVFNTQFEVMKSALFLTASIGVSLYPEHGADIDSLLKNADIAVIKAKENGKNRIVFFNEPMNESLIEKMQIERCLWSALPNNEFQLYYQPQLDLITNKITGFEALLRWKNEELGMVPPKKFINIAEETRLIILIGEWVFKSACEFLKRLHRLGHEDMGISINISMIQLLQDDFVDMVIDTIDEIEINARLVELEITESVLMEFYETIAGKLRLLRSRGIKIALDDFGKGYSSLNYLIQLPITTLKIDKTFIDTISSDGKKKSITSLVVNLGRNMDLNVVAEGVEQKEQMEYLTQIKCDKIQGYYFSKPLPESEIIRKMGENWNENQ